MQESRLFKIIYCLLERGQATAPELAEKFEVSVRTVYRDIDVISSAGIPIYATAGRHGGIQLYEDFILNKALLSEQDIQDMMIGLQSLSAAQYPDYEDTLLKLKAILKTADTNWIEVDFSRWGSIAQKEKREFALLKTAVINRQEVTFCYHNSSGNTESRRCRPLKLFYKDKAWYLYGYCCKRNDCRLFRISRMQNLELTDTIFEQISADAISAFPLPEDMGTVIDIELKFPKKMAHRVFDSFSEDAVTQQDAHLTVKTKIPQNDWLFEFIMSFGNNIEIIHPPSLKTEIIKRLNEALVHHNSYIKCPIPPASRRNSRR